MLNNNNFEILVSIKGVKYKLDIFDDDQMNQFGLDMSVSDINDIASKNASSSKTLSIPDTNNNRYIFGFINQIGLSNDFVDLLYNPMVRTPCEILINTIKIPGYGNIQVTNYQMDLDKGKNIFKLQIYGTGYDLIKNLGERYLSDLEGLSIADHMYDVNTITASWYQDPENRLYYYPLIDYGFGLNYINLGYPIPNDPNTGKIANISSTGSTIQFNQLFPAFSHKFVWNTMFQAATFSMISDYFTQDPQGVETWNKMILPFVNDQLLPGYDTSNYAFFVGPRINGPDQNIEEIKLRTISMLASGDAPISSSPNYYFYNSNNVYIRRVPINFTYPTIPTIVDYPYFNSYSATSSTASISTGFPFYGSKENIDIVMSNGYPYFEGIVSLPNPYSTDMGTVSCLVNRSPNVVPFKPQLNLTFYLDILNNYYDILYVDWYRTYDRLSGTFGTPYICGQDFLFIGSWWLWSDGNRSNPFTTSADERTFPFWQFGTSDGAGLGFFDATGGGFLSSNSNKFYVNPGVTMSYRNPGGKWGLHSATQSCIVNYNNSDWSNKNKLQAASKNSRQFFDFNGSMVGHTVSNTVFIPYGNVGVNSKYVNSDTGEIYLQPGEKTFCVLNRLTFQNPSEGGVYFNSLGITNSVQGLYTNSYPAPYTGLSFSLTYNDSSESTSFTINSATISVNNAVSSKYGDYITYGNRISATQAIANNVKCKDYISSIINMFNLYVEPVPGYPNLLRIEPRDVYYGQGKIWDWTSKLDLSKPVQIQILSDLQKRTTDFKYKTDNDYYNTLYLLTKQNQLNHGQKRFEIDNDYLSDSKKIELLFGPAPLVNIPGTGNFPIPIICKQLDPLTNLSSGKVNISPRILFGNTVSFWYPDYDRFNFESQQYSFYPYAGHYDNPYEPTLDLSYETLADFYQFPFNTSGFTRNNLFNLYWKSAMDEISDPTSKIIEVDLYLNALDLSSFSFADTILLKLGNSQYAFHVDRLENVDITGITPCTARLILSKFNTIPSDPTDDRYGYNRQPNWPNRITTTTQGPPTTTTHFPKGFGIANLTANAIVTDTTWNGSTIYGILFPVNPGDSKSGIVPYEVATVVVTVTGGTFGYITLLDPTGQDFCLDYSGPGTYIFGSVSSMGFDDVSVGLFDGFTCGPTTTTIAPTTTTSGPTTTTTSGPTTTTTSGPTTTTTLAPTTTTTLPHTTAIAVFNLVYSHSANIAYVRWNNNPISGATFPLSGGNVTFGSVPSGTGTITVFVAGVSGNIQVYDSAGNLYCKNYYAPGGVGLYVFPGIAATGINSEGATSLYVYVNEVGTLC